MFVTTIMCVILVTIEVIGVNVFSIQLKKKKNPNNHVSSETQHSKVKDKKH